MARLLVDRSVAGEERYAFWDDQVQEVLYESIATARRRRYHLRAGRALEEVYADRLETQLEELARHFSEGIDAARATTYALQAAEKNSRLFQWSRVRRLYELAVDALAHLPETIEMRRRRVDTILRLVSAAYTAGDPEQSLARLAEAEALASTLTQFNPPPAGGSGPDELGGDLVRLARVQYWMGRLQYYRYEYPAALNYFEQALATARAAGDEALMLSASRSIGVVLWVQGYPGRAIPPLSQPLGPREKTASAWAGMLAMAHAMVGDYRTGLAEQERALARARAVNDPRALALSYNHLALVHFAGGELPRMLEASRACVQAAEECGEQIYVYFALAWQALAESRLGHHEAASASLTGCRAIRRSLGQRLLYGDWIAAAEAEVALNAGRLEEACALAEQAVGAAQAVGGIFAEGLAQRVWGQALAALDLACHGEAEEHLAASLRCFEEGEHRLEAARTRLAWGLLCRARGHTISALDHLERAAAQFEASGLSEELERTRAARQDLAGPVKDRATKERERGAEAYPDGLTAREVEVLRHIASGRTNKEIADELVLSLATVERHNFNIYTKVGARGRSDATAYALRHGLVAGRDQ